MTRITMCFGYLLLCFKPPPNLLKAKIYLHRILPCSFSWEVFLMTPEVTHTSQSSGKGWKATGALLTHLALWLGELQSVWAVREFHSSIRSLQQVDWASFHDESKCHRVEVEAPRFLSIRPMACGRSRPQHSLGRSTSRDQPTFNGWGIWLHLERGCKVFWPWFPVHHLMAKRMVHPNYGDKSW